MFCKNCGSELKDDALFCPNCGTAVASRQTPPPASTQPAATPMTQTQSAANDKNTVALVGFILSFFVALPGLICSIIGFKRAKAGAPRGGLALAGIIISAVSYGIAFIILIAYPELFLYWLRW